MQLCEISAIRSNTYVATNKNKQDLNRSSRKVWIAGGGRWLVCILETQQKKMVEEENQAMLTMHTA